MPLSAENSSSTRSWIQDRRSRGAGGGDGLRLARHDLGVIALGRSRTPAPEPRARSPRSIQWRSRSNGYVGSGTRSRCSPACRAASSTGTPAAQSLPTAPRKNASSGIFSDGCGSVGTTTWPSTRPGCCRANPLSVWPGPDLDGDLRLAPQRRRQPVHEAHGAAEVRDPVLGTA